MAPLARTSKRGKANPSVRSRPGLSLTEESPARPISSFFIPNTAAGGPSKRPQVEVNGTATAPSKGKAKPDDKSDAANAKELWVDQVAPLRKSEVAVHKKKVEQVEGWLYEALNGTKSIRKYRRILVLSGPAGSGKSALVRALSHEEDLNFDVVEWTEAQRQISPSTSSWDRGRRAWRADVDTSWTTYTQHSRLSDFLSHASRFSSLILDSGEQVGDALPTPPAGTPSATRSGSSTSRPHRVIVLDDLPNLQHEATRLSFQAALTSFLLAEIHNESAPLVVILSDSTPRLAEWDISNSAQGWKDRLDNTLNVRNIIPEQVINHPGFCHIAFNSVAVTFLRKALITVLTAQRRLDPDRVPPPTSVRGKELVEAIVNVSSGDIRSAINALQIVLTRSAAGQRADGVKRTADGKAKRKNGVPSIDSLVSAAVGRESTMALFHALGRVLYNKREGDPTDDKKADDMDSNDEEEEEQEADSLGSGQTDWLATAIQSFLGVDDASEDGMPLPSHLAHMHRRKSRVDIEKLWRSMPMDVSTLQIFLHQNYTPFCEEVEQCQQLLDCMSYADCLKPKHEEWYHASLTQYYGFLVATHGTLMSLPSPMPRKKERRFRGMFFFDALKRARRTHETIAGVEDDLRSRGASLEYRPNVLSGLSSEQLASEVLPLLAKCRSLPGELKACIEFTDFRRTDSEQLRSSFGGADEEEMLNEAGQVPDTQESRLYDDEGNRVNVQLVEGNTMVALAPLDSLNSLAGEFDPQIVESSDDDEIEDIG